MGVVEKDAEISLVVLVFRSLEWLKWCQRGVEESKNQTRYRWFVVACDPTEEVRASKLVDLVYDNDNPNEFYINRVYRAWNEGVLCAPTPYVVMLNSDMYGSDYWLDQLVGTRRRDRRTVPTSLLVESGKLESGMPEYVKNFGMHPGEFDAEGFKRHAGDIRKPNSTESGRLFMPILVSRQEFFDVGGYPEGNPTGTTGDKDLIRRYAEAGFRHVTALGSVVYHCQLGEQHWP